MISSSFLLSLPAHNKCWVPNTYDIFFLNVSCWSNPLMLPQSSKDHTFCSVMRFIKSNLSTVNNKFILYQFSGKILRFPLSFVLFFKKSIYCERLTYPAHIVIKSDIRWLSIFPSIIKASLTLWMANASFFTGKTLSFRSR